MEWLDEENAYLLGNKLGSILKVESVDVNKPFLGFRSSLIWNLYCNPISIYHEILVNLFGFLVWLVDVLLIQLGLVLMNHMLINLLWVSI